MQKATPNTETDPILRERVSERVPDYLIHNGSPEVNTLALNPSCFSWLLGSSGAFGDTIYHSHVIIITCFYFSFTWDLRQELRGEVTSLIYLLNITT